MTRLLHRVAFFNVSAILLVSWSCGGPNMNPPADRARTALEAALNAWRDGKKPGNIEGATPPVHVADNDWTNGRKLAAFEIVGEEPSAADKRFTVKLTYDKPSVADDGRLCRAGREPDRRVSRGRLLAHAQHGQ